MLLSVFLVKNLLGWLVDNCFAVVRYGSFPIIFGTSFEGMC